MRTIDFHSECVLLDPEDSRQTALVNLYNEVVRFLESLPEGLLDYLIAFSTDRKKASPMADRSGGLQAGSGSLKEQVEAVADALTRRRYRIGFVGRSQLGKSSAVNQMLDCKILKEGGSRACTSVVTVIEAQESQKKFSFRAQYFTKEEFQRRFEGVAGRLQGCPISHLPDDITTLGQVRQQLLDWSRQIPVGDPDELNPGEYLAAMVDQARLGHGRMGKPSEEVVCVSQSELYDKLENLVAYRPGQADTGNDQFFPLLVKEFVVQTHMPGFGRVTMIDLPGLGTFHSADSKLTEEYVRSLDGLLLFVRPNSLDNEELKALVKIFGEEHTVTKGRAWFIVTAFDGLDPSERDGRFFGSLGSVIRTLGVRSDWVRFFSAYCMIRGEDDTEKVVTRTLKSDKPRLAEGLRLRFNGTGLVQPGAPPQDFEPFESAFSSYMNDGGYEELRRVMDSHVAGTVQLAVCEEAAKRLSEIIRLIQLAVDAAAQGGLDEENQAIADSWATVFVAIPIEFAPGRLRNDLSQIVGELFADLWQIIEQFATVNNVNDVRQANHDPRKQEDHPWVMLHRTMTREMARTIRRSAPEIEKRYIKLVQSSIEQEAKKKKRLNDNGNLCFPQGVSPLVQLSVLFNESTLKESLATDLDVLQSVRVIQNEKNREVYTYVCADDYRLIMQRKVEAICYMYLARMRRHVLRCCSEVQYELYRRADPRLQPSRLEPGKHKQLASQLGDLLHRLSKLTFASN